MNFLRVVISLKIQYPLILFSIPVLNLSTRVTVKPCHRMRISLVKYEYTYLFVNIAPEQCRHNAVYFTEWELALSLTNLFCTNRAEDLRQC